MNRNEYLAELKDGLKKLPPEEYHNAVCYYEEYFDDAGEENEQSVVEELGPPQALAAQIIGNFAMKEPDPQTPRTKKGISVVWMVVLAIFASPIALPLGLAAVVIVFAMLLVLFSVIIAFGAAALGCVLGGLACLIMAFPLLMESAGTALFALGLGLVAISIGLFFGLLVKVCSQKSVQGIAYLAGKFLVRKTKA